MKAVIVMKETKYLINTNSETTVTKPLFAFDSEQAAIEFLKGLSYFFDETKCYTVLYAANDLTVRSTYTTVRYYVVSVPYNQVYKEV